MIGLLIFNEEIIKIIFEHGMFTSESTLQTAKALKWYAMGLPFYGIYKIFVPTFYAIDRQKIPVYCSIFSIAANVIFCILLTPVYGFEVLAFGTTLSMFLNSTIQTFILKSDLDLKITHFINFRLIKVLIASILTFTASSYVKTILIFGGQSFWIQASELFFNLSFIVMCYGILVFALGERSIVLNFVNKLKNKL
jgi:putative peptidoglycan lipid II flippase